MDNFQGQSHPGRMTLMSRVHRAMFGLYEVDQTLEEKVFFHRLLMLRVAGLVIFEATDPKWDDVEKSKK